MIIVDIFGIGGLGKVIEKFMEYFFNVLLFIFVINVGSVGGM